MASGFGALAFEAPASLGDADQEVVFDMAFNWSMAQHPTSLDFEVLYTAVDTLASLQLEDLAALAFVPHSKTAASSLNPGATSSPRPSGLASTPPPFVSG